MDLTTSEKSPAVFQDYEMLGTIKKLETGRLCELAILKWLSQLNYTTSSVIQSYNPDEHQKLWLMITDCFQKNQKQSGFFEYFCQFMTQFSPEENAYANENVNHLKHYIKTAAEINNALGRRGNIVELGANHGLLSKTLQILGHHVLCTDLHHGIVSNSIQSYKTGTWVRENVIGLHTVDSFRFDEDNLENLNIFETGIDAVIMRGTGIVNIRRSEYMTLMKRIKRKMKRTLKIKEAETIDTPVRAVLQNIDQLLGIINDQGIIYAKNENVFGEYPFEERINCLRLLVKYAGAHNIAVTYTVEKEKYANYGWEPFNITLNCKKLTTA